MRRSIGMTMLLACLVAAACSKDENKQTESTKATEKTTGATTPSPTTTGEGQTPAADPGVEAGGIERDKDEGPAAVITAVQGTVEVRRVGEIEYQAAKADTQLYPGDQVRTGEQSSATIAMADESVVELAEVSTIGVATREGSADPASGAAVLAGLARFTVTARAPGEGAFKVYTPSGVILTKGTVYAVGVAVTGEARIGVESGAIDVVGLANVAAEPVVIETGNAATITAEGSVGQPAAWGEDDWGTWRAEADAEAELGAVVSAHGEAMADLGAALASAYAELEAAAETAAELEVKAATAAEAQATADYEVVAPEAAANIEASFGLAGHLEALTWAYASHATLAKAVYVRHPEAVKAEWEVVAPKVEAAVLWPKRFEITSAAYLEPLRVQYYVHHPRGRAHAELVGVAVPEFYANVNVPEPEPAKVRARVRTKVWTPPVVRVKASARPVWIAAPRPGWRAKVKVKAAPPRAKVAWYVRAPEVKGKVLLGADVKAKWQPTRIKVQAPEPRAKLRAKFRVDTIGTRIKVGPPDLDAAAKARVNVKLGGDGRVIVRDHRGAASGAAGAGVKIKGDVKSAVDVRTPDAPDVKVKVRDHRDSAAGAAGDAKVKVKGTVGGAADVKGDVKAKVKVKAPEPPKVKVKVKAPEPPKVKVKAKGEVKGGIKIGN